MSPDSSQFIHGLLECGLASVQELQQPNYAKCKTDLALCRALIENGRLTSYQASELMAGRSKSLVVNNLVILEELGGGQLSRVFLAEHRMMKRPVALKVLTPPEQDQDEFAARFTREIQAVASLDHPNIVRAHDAGQSNGTPYLVMEYVQGQDLDKQVQKYGPLSITNALDAVMQAAHGFAYAHERGIVHRDIKPSNLLRDNNGIVKILDLGLALRNEAVAESITGEFQILGTIDYMSPEQAESSQVGATSDIYSLGCTLYRLLTGVPPYHASRPIDVLLAHRKSPIPSVRKYCTGASRELELLLLRMMAKAAKDRPQTMNEVIGEFSTLLAKARQHEKKVANQDTRELTLAEIKGQQDESAAKTDLKSGRVKDRRTTQIRQIVPVGIDLGTTGSVIAHVDALGRPRAIANSEGEIVTPSVLLFEGKKVIVGKEALKAIATDGARVAQFAKRDVGSAAYHRQIGGRSFPPEVLQAMILRKLISDAERSIKRIKQAVVTVPAYFDEVRRKATQDAAYMAGIEALDIINEPTAAAIAFGAQHGLLTGRTTGQKSRTLLVYDLGGGTFDVTIMRIDDRSCQTIATDGDMQLGGREFDERLVDFVAETFLKKHKKDPREDLSALALLWRECEEAKHALSARSRATINCHYGGEALQVKLTRKQFESLIADLVERTVFTVKGVLEGASLRWKDIDHVLLVGGSTRIPMVANQVTKISGKKPDTSISPDEAVAHGAALYAGALLRERHGDAPIFSVQNVNSHTLGVAGRDTQTGKPRVSTLIPRNSILPAQAAKRYKTRTADQRSLVVEIVEGESPDPADCFNLGSCVLKNLKPGMPAGTPVEVRFRYESNGRLQIDVNVKGESLHHEITREGSLDAKQVEAWREKITKPRGSK